MKYNIVFIYSLILGSYLNVVGTRSCAQPNTNQLRSYCDQCQRILTPLELIPVLSYILQRGRCRECREAISMIYPVMEFLTALVMTGLFWEYGWSLEFMFYSVLLSLLIILTVSDIYYFKISNRLLLLFAPVLLILSPLTIKEMLIGAGVQLLIFILAILIYPSSIGMGDIKLFLLLGAVVGYDQSLWVLCLSSIFGVIYHIFIEADRIPFVPFILSGMICTLVVGAVFH